MKMTLKISKILEISDPVYTFSEVLNHIDMKKYLAEGRIRRTGRPEYNSEKLLRIVLFAFINLFCKAINIKSTIRICRAISKITKAAVIIAFVITNRM